MKKMFVILSIVLLCLLDDSICLAQQDVSSYDLDDIMREMLDPRMDVLEDTISFIQQMPYYKKLYDMLNDSARLDLIQSSTKLWYNAGLFKNEKDSIRGDELNFYIKISRYFQCFYAEQQKRKYIEKWGKEIGDSLHFVFNVDGDKIPNSKYQMYGVAVSKDNHQKKIYTVDKGASAIFISKEEEPVEFIIVVKYKNKYIPVSKTGCSLQDLSGTLCTCNLYTKKTLKTVIDCKISDDNLKNLDAYVRTVLETLRSTGVETSVFVDNLKKISKENKKLIK